MNVRIGLFEVLDRLEFRSLLFLLSMVDQVGALSIRFAPSVSVPSATIVVQTILSSWAALLTLLN